MNTYYTFLMVGISSFESTYSESPECSADMSYMFAGFLYYKLSIKKLQEISFFKFAHAYTIHYWHNILL